MTHEHMTDASFAMQCVINRKARTTGIAEDRVYSMADQRIEQTLGAVAPGRSARDARNRSKKRRGHDPSIQDGAWNFLLVSLQFPPILDNLSFKIATDRMTIDRFDLRILDMLQRNSRTTLQEVSAQVGLSPTPCWNRIKRLEADGVIQRYTIKIDQGALGYFDTVIVQLTLDNHTDSMIDDFGRALEGIPEVLEAFLVSGDYDYIVRIAVRDTRDYERLLRERLYKIPGIRHSKSSFVLRTLKLSDTPLQPVDGTRDVKRRRPSGSKRSDR